MALDTSNGLPLLSCDVDITFPTAEKAALVCAVLQVDDELQPNKITKTFTQEGPILHIAFVSKDAKVLRVAISSFYDMLTVSLKTLREFDDDGN